MPAPDKKKSARHADQAELSFSNEYADWQRDLAEIITISAVNAWFLNVRVHEGSDGTVIETPSPFRQQHILGNIGYMKAIRSIFGDNVQITSTPAEDLSKSKALVPSDRALQLPLWSETERGVPNVMLRSALFAAIQGKTRKLLWDQKIASYKGVTITYSGKQLDQSDLDVFEQALHLCSKHPLENECLYKDGDFLKALNRSCGSKDKLWLDGAFLRLSACVVRITDAQNNLYDGGLILERKRHGPSGMSILRMSKDIIKLFQQNTWTKTNFSERAKLTRQPLALWLHSFYSTHARPYDMTVELLRDLSGSEDKCLYNFKRRLDVALTKLEEIGFLDDFNFDKMKVSVERSFDRPTAYLQ